MTLDSFMSQDYQNYKIIVADNGSTDGSLEYLKQYKNIIEIIENGENLGYANGNNKAIEWALIKNADYILLANNDLYIDNTNLLSQIVLSFHALQNINFGIYGIQERDYYLQNRIVSEGHFLFDDFSNSRIEFNQKRLENQVEVPIPFRYVDFVSGSFILINREVFEKCGLLDGNFFMYQEEAELCFRAWNNAYVVVVNPQIHYFHKIAKSSGKGSPFKIYYRIRNNFYFLKKHKEIIKYYSYYTSRYSKTVAISLFKNIVLLPFRYSTGRINILRAMIWAIVDTFNNRYGFREIKN